MSIQSKVTADLSYHDRQKAKLYAFWQLVAEYLPAKLLDLNFSAVYCCPDSDLPRLELSYWAKDETWMDRIRTLFAAEANVLFEPIVSAN